ncbi:MAG: MASE1 domain-containing protein, partial [Gemmatimonadota bacterium]|nr:MASE1 domain-containing protein [Gemmatimonadota bacterium]
METTNRMPDAARSMLFGAASPRPGFVALAAGAVAMGGSYLAADLAFHMVVTWGTSRAVFLWPPTGLVVGALVLLERRWWAPVVAGAFLGNVLAAPPTFTVLLAVASSGANSLEQVLCAMAFLRLASSPPRCVTLQDVGALVAVATGVVGLTAFAGAAVVALNLGAPPRAGWAQWWVADGLSVLVIVPLVLTLAGAIEQRRMHKARALEALAVSAAIALAGYSLVRKDLSSESLGIGPHAYTVYPLLVWAAVRTG